MTGRFLWTSLRSAFASVQTNVSPTGCTAQTTNILRATSFSSWTKLGMKLKVFLLAVTAASVFSIAHEWYTEGEGSTFPDSETCNGNGVCLLALFLFGITLLLLFLVSTGLTLFAAPMMKVILWATKLQTDVSIFSFAVNCVAFCLSWWILSRFVKLE